MAHWLQEAQKAVELVQPHSVSQNRVLAESAEQVAQRLGFDCVVTSLTGVELDHDWRLVLTNSMAGFHIFHVNGRRSFFFDMPLHDSPQLWRAKQIEIAIHLQEEGLI